MSDKINVAELVTSLKDNYRNSVWITPAVLLYCIENVYEASDHLGKSGCNVAMLTVGLKSIITENQEMAIRLDIFDALSSSEPQISSDCHLLLSKFESDLKPENGSKGTTFEDMLDFIFRTNAKREELYEDTILLLKASGYVHGSIDKGELGDYKILNKYCLDLITEASNSKLDPLIGREEEVNRMIEVLAHYKKRNPLLVGKAGVGKTIIVEGLASAISQGRVPEPLKNAKILSTSIAKLMAGTKFRGDLEEKVENMLKEIQKFESDKGVPTFLFIDEIHQIIGAGNNGNSGGGSDIANIIKPALSSGKIALIGATTETEYKKSIQKDSALDRRFQTIKVEEPSEEETIKIIRRGVAPVLSSYHGVELPISVIKKAVKLAGKYITDRAQPDKSIALLDSVGARLRTTDIRAKAKVSDVEKLVSQITGTPVSAFKDKSKASEYVDIEVELNKLVYGQSDAIKKISEVYERSKAGLSEEGQPIGSILAIGPTGVGKTQVAVSLSEITNSHFFKINMGEYTEKHSVSKLFGAPPGYVGHEDGGLLTNEIRKYPHTVLLLDEIEKAHPKVFEALLGIIDGAKMTDGEGNEVDFRNVLIIMTSNVGAAVAAKRSPLGFGRNEDTIEKVKAQVSTKALESTFSPEFRNKLTAIVNFGSLGTEEINKVTDKFLSLAKGKLKERKGITLSFDKSVYEYVSTKGFNPAFGARPIKKLIDAEIIDVLVKPLLKGEVSKGDVLEFKVESDELVFEVVNNNSVVEVQ